MTILIDPTSATPLYEQIVQQIQRQILSGTLPRQEMRGWLERAVSAAKAAGVSREEIIEQISRLYDQAGEEK